MYGGDDTTLNVSVVAVVEQQRRLRVTRISHAGGGALYIPKGIAPAHLTRE